MVNTSNVHDTHTQAGISRYCKLLRNTFHF